MKRLTRARRADLLLESAGAWQMNEVSSLLPLYRDAGGDNQAAQIWWWVAMTFSPEWDIARAAAASMANTAACRLGYDLQRTKKVARLVGGKWRAIR